MEWILSRRNHLNKSYFDSGREKRLYSRRIWAGVRSVRAGGVPGEPYIRRAPQQARPEAALQWRDTHHRHVRHFVRVSTL